MRSAPVLCVEILSKNDTLNTMQERIDDYRSLGVPNIWILDPARHKAYSIHADRPERVELEQVDQRLSLPNTEVVVDLPQLFDELDNLLAGRF